MLVSGLELGSASITFGRTDHVEKKCVGRTADKKYTGFMKHLLVKYLKNVFFSSLLTASSERGVSLNLSPFWMICLPIFPLALLKNFQIFGCLLVTKRASFNLLFRYRSDYLVCVGILWQRMTGYILPIPMGVAL